MGFRNPVTTVQAVDTGQPAGAGVRVYQKDTPTGTVGVIELRDGIAGDDPSVIEATANLIPQDDGGYTSQGGMMSFKAGSWNGEPGPRLDFGVEADPAGGYRPFARLIGAEELDHPAAPARGAARAITPRGDNGQITVPHGLGVVPSCVQITTAIAYSANNFNMRVFSRDATNLYLIAFQNNALLTGGTLDFDWIAYP